MAKRLSRYSRYSGGPDPLAPPVDLREALDAIGEDVMSGASPRRALQELMRCSAPMPQALRSLQELASRREELLSATGVCPASKSRREVHYQRPRCGEQELVRHTPTTAQRRTQAAGAAHFAKLAQCTATGAGVAAMADAGAL